MSTATVSTTKKIPARLRMRVKKLSMKHEAILEQVIQTEGIEMKKWEEYDRRTSAGMFERGLVRFKKETVTESQIQSDEDVAMGSPRHRDVEVEKVTIIATDLGIALYDFFTDLRANDTGVEKTRKPRQKKTTTKSEPTEEKKDDAKPAAKKPTKKKPAAKKPAAETKDEGQGELFSQPVSESDVPPPPAARDSNDDTVPQD